MKLSTINQIVQSLADEADVAADEKKKRQLLNIANEATIYLKAALICENKGIDEALEYFRGNHGEDEYKEWLTGVEEPVIISRTKRYGGLDYDLFVINAQNVDTTPEQLRDCLYDALTRIDARLNIIEDYINREDLQKGGQEWEDSRQSRM